MNKSFMPENDYNVDYSATREQISEALKNNATITGIVTDIDSQKQTLKVCIGNDIFGIMPWSEASLYNLTYKKGISPDIPQQILVLTYKKVRTKVKKIKADGTIILSRKDNMLEAWESVIAAPDNLYNANIVGYYDSGVFYDIGEGICAFCYVYDYSLCRFDLPKVVKINTEDTVKLISFDPNNDHRITCSRKLGSSTCYSDFKQGRIVQIRLGKPVYQNDDHEDSKLTGYFVELAPNVSGIADVNPHLSVKTGDIVFALIKSVNVPESKIKLDIIDK